MTPCKGKTLILFQIDPDLKFQFKQYALAQKTTMTDLLTEFIVMVLNHEAHGGVKNGNLQ